MSTRHSAILVAVMGALLCACGGKEASAPTPPAPAGNSAPAIAGTPATSTTAGSVYSFTPSASDADGNSLAFLIANKPAWASFNTGTGELSGTPGAQHVGSYANIRISVSDGNATASLTAFAIAVVQAPANSATLKWNAPTQNVDDSTLTDLAGYYVYRGNSANALNRIATIASPSIVSTVIGSLSSGTHYFAVSAYTSAGVESALSAVGSKVIP